MADVFCSDCKKSTEVVLDHSTGDTVCFECGLVLESHYIDETSEWRTFADDGCDNDPIRVGGPSNPLLADRQLTTVISKPKGTTSDFLTTSLQRWSAPDPDRNRIATLVRAFESIDNMAQKLGIVARIKDRANELFKNLVEDQKAGYRIKNRNATLAACLYLACRQEDIPRTLKEMCTVANGATMKEIGRAAKCIAKHVPSMEMGTGTLHSGSLMMSRFGSYLGFTYQAVKAAQEAVLKIEELDIRRVPTSIAAAVIYMVSELSDEKKSLHDVSVATGVAQGTIKECYKDLHPYISRIIPTWFSQTVKA